jgi:hypothetical protein
MEGCTSGANESFCRCSIEAIQEAMSYEEFVAAERVIEEGRESQAIVDAVRKCTPELEPSPSVSKLRQVSAGFNLPARRSRLVFS